MSIDFFISRFEQNKGKEAIVWKENVYIYEDILNAYNKFKDLFLSENLKGKIVSIEGDFSLNSVSALFALIKHNNIIVPISHSPNISIENLIQTAEVEFRLVFDSNDGFQIIDTGIISNHFLLKKLKIEKKSGLILFSSGSSGISKAIVHDMSNLLDKFKILKKTKRSLAFLLFDHIGGLNTLFYNLSNLGCLIFCSNRNTSYVCHLIEKYKVQILPTSPTFINLLLLSEEYKNLDLSSLELITYGTEPMSESTLKRISSLFPNIKFQQTYGLSEIGIMRSQSEENNSLWVKIGGEDFQTRVADGLLEVKAKSSMLGYLNFESPFTEDGWFKTGDAVEQKGDYFKILGRKSEIINIGGQKVYPIEIEGLILEISGVIDVSIKAESNPITGNIMVATVNLNSDENVEDFKKRMRSFLKNKVESFKIPHKVIIKRETFHNERFKKIRR